MNALLVKNGEITRIELPEEESNWRNIQDLIGNWVSTAFVVNGANGKPIYGYCDDEGALPSDPDWNVLPVLYGQPITGPIAGPIVIVGGDYQGESRSLAEEEMKSFTIVPAQSPLDSWNAYGLTLPPIPILRYTRSKGEAV